MKDRLRMNQKFEIRDLREKDQYKIDDKFLNGYAKYVEIYGVGVYNDLCRHSNKEQKCWPSAKAISEKLNISMPKVFYSLWVLEFFNIIIRERIGKKCNNRYSLLHKKNWKKIDFAIKELESDINKVNISDVNVVNIRYKRHLHHILTTFTSIVRSTHSKETKVRVVVADATTKKLTSEYIDSAKSKHIKIVLLYARMKNKQEWSASEEQSFIKRNVRAAKILEPYSYGKINEVMKWLKENADFKWTLETVGKYIDEDLPRLKVKLKKDLGEDDIEIPSYAKDWQK